MAQTAALNARIGILKRKPRRASVTLPDSVIKELQELADQEGRSLSNVMAFLLEAHLRQHQEYQSQHHHQ